VKGASGPSEMVRDFNLPSTDWSTHTATNKRLVQFLAECEVANMEQLIKLLT
jgi:hypothetical protein